MQHKNIILGALLALASTGPLAQQVWRCGNSYSEQPCAGGSAVAAPHQPSAAEAAKASGAAKSDAQRAEALEKARLAQEKSAPKAVVIASPEAPKPVADKALAKTGLAKPEQFTAVAPGSGKKPEKATTPEKKAN